MLIPITIFSCGGTIDKVYFDAKSEYTVGEPQIEVIFREAGVSCAYRIESLFRKDSLEMTASDRQLLRRRVREDENQRILITHGTDTMTETAESLLGIPGKTIVLTGSMTPVRFRESDAIFNIGFAMGALSCLAPGVYLAMHGRIFTAGTVRKNRELNRFEEI
jgi:L-asparaginase